MENSIVVELVWEKAVSKKNTEYEGLFAILPNGKKVLVTLNKVTYLTIKKYSK